MSYMFYKMECRNCKKDWTTSFGVVGITQVATPTTECPYCKSPDIFSPELPPQTTLTTSEEKWSLKPKHGSR